MASVSKYLTKTWNNPYSREMLLLLRNNWKFSIDTQRYGSMAKPLSSELWNTLRSYGILASFRGERGGNHNRLSFTRKIATIASSKEQDRIGKSSKWKETRSNLLNIHIGTSSSYSSGTTTQCLSTANSISNIVPEHDHRFAYKSTDMKNLANKNNLTSLILKNMSDLNSTISVSVVSVKRPTLSKKLPTTEDFNCSVDTNFGQQHKHSTTTKSVINLDPIDIKRVRIATLNSQSSKWDENLVLAIELCKHYNIEILGVQESWRTGSEYIEFENDDSQQWKWINFGYEKKSRAGAGFILGPNVKVMKTVEHLPGRILTIYVKCYGLCLRITNVYAPTEVENSETKQRFYKELRKAITVNEMRKYKQVLVGDFNAVIADDSREGFTSIIGKNNPLSNTNENGRLLLEFCQEHKLRIINTIFMSKRIHRDTHILPDGTKRRLDYIIAGPHLLKVIKNCRVYNKPTNNWKNAIGTDHSMVISDMMIPCNGKSLKRKLRITNTKTQNGKWDVTLLRDNDEYKERF